MQPYVTMQKSPEPERKLLRQKSTYICGLFADYEEGTPGKRALIRPINIFSTIEDIAQASPFVNLIIFKVAYKNKRKFGAILYSMEREGGLTDSIRQSQSYEQLKIFFEYLATTKFRDHELKVQVSQN